MTLSMTTFSIMTITLMTSSITTFSIISLTILTYSITTLNDQHNGDYHNIIKNAALTIMPFDNNAECFKY